MTTSDGGQAWRDAVARARAEGPLPPDVEEQIAEVERLEAAAVDAKRQRDELRARFDELRRSPLIDGGTTTIGEVVTAMIAEVMSGRAHRNPSTPSGIPRGTRVDRVVPGGRFIHSIRSAYTSVLADGRRHGGIDDAMRDARLAPYLVNALVTLRALDDPETRRIVVDARQAMTFADVGGMPPVDRYRMPFDNIYVEFTEPIYFGEQEPGYDDEIVAMMLNTEEHFPSAHFDDLIVQPPGVVTVTMFLRQRDHPEDWADRRWFFSLDTGDGMASYETLTGGEGGDSDRSTYTEDERALIGDTEHGWMVVRRDGPGRGWWERVVLASAEFTAWLLTYLTAKGIVIVEADAPSRQVKRARLRMKHRPPAWHVVKVDPVTIRHESPDGREGGKHSYRYDVRGHLRFGRHKRGDGTYSQTVEWIAPHQRGLAHALYVPKTYLYKDGARRVVPPIEG